jgi:pterin-4a-carbinolamine dehydratase
MKKSPLMSLMEEYVERPRPSLFDRLPVDPKAKEVPIVASEKWINVDGRLTRSFKFDADDARNEFVRDVLDHETEVGHHVVMIVKEGLVELTLTTEGVGITEIDKEFSTWLVRAYKDVVYGPKHKTYGL